MKYMNFKTVTLMLSAFALIALSGCEKEGTPSNTQLVGSGTPPVAVAKVDPSTATIGDTVTVDGSGSYDEDGEIVSYVWQFQDIILGEGVTIDAPTESFAAGTYTIKLVVTDNDGNTGTDSVEVTLEEPADLPTCLETAGFGTITLANGQIWLDRNLGASKVADDVNDTAAFGDLYQWGRATDGHEKRTSTTTQVLADNIVAGHPEFIVGGYESTSKTMSASYNTRTTDNDYGSDWVEPGIDDNGSLRYVGWKAVNSSTQICPCGYVVPSAKDYIDLDTTDIEKLHIVFTGHKNYGDGSISDPEEWAYWTRNPSYNNYVPMVFSTERDEGGDIHSDVWPLESRAYGLEVRCINPAQSKEYTIDDEPMPD